MSRPCFVGWVERSETHHPSKNEDGGLRLALTHPTQLASFSSKSCTTPPSRSSLYPVIGNGFAPDTASLAATAMFSAFAGLPCNAASAACEPQRHRCDAAGGEADELERAVGDHGAGADFDQRPFRMAAADRALVERALALPRRRQFDAADHLARQQRIVGGAVGAVAEHVGIESPLRW